VGLVKQDKASDGNVLIEQFPKQMQSVVEMIWKKLSKDIPDNLDAVRDCQAIKFCQELRLRISSPTIPLKEIAQEVNKNDWGWKADENSKFLGITHEDAQSMLGTIVDPAMVVKMPTFA
jgi:cathepsin B